MRKYLVGLFQGLLARYERQYITIRVHNVVTHRGAPPDIQAELDRMLARLSVQVRVVRRVLRLLGAGWER